MIDLDALELEETREWTEEDELYCQFGAALCRNTLTYTRFQNLRGLYVADRYIYPDARVIHIPLIEYLLQLQATRTDVSWLFSLYINVSHVHAHYTETEQVRILEILQEKNQSLP